MFETAELGHTISKAEYAERMPVLREKLLEAQYRLRSAEFPVLVLFAGVDGAGKGETANLLNSWMDPRQVVTRAYGPRSDEEQERPPLWRYWRDLPSRGQIGLFLSGWYSGPFLARVFEQTTEAEFLRELDRIETLERMLADDGAVILKFWMHLGKEQQKQRFETLEADPLRAWRVTERDWKHWEKYDRFVATAGRLISRTSTGEAPWHIVEGTDQRYRSLEVTTLLLDAVHRGLEDEERRKALNDVVGNGPKENGSTEDEALLIPPSEVRGAPSVLSRLDCTLKVSKADYQEELVRLQGRLNLAHRQARENGISTILVFEGWDAAGKGGAIRRVTGALEARHYQVIPIAAPTDEERAHHYLWRFWRHMSRAGRVTIFDRSWYGRVLVERVEGFASEEEWRRAYAEINDLEEQWVEHGIVLAKFWVHITRDEQEERFLARQDTSYKQWKLTDEDWRNREQWEAYETGVNEMVERTSTPWAPWTLVEGNSKRFARLKVLRTVCDALERRLGTEAGE